MIYECHVKNELPVELCCINGDRVALSTDILKSFALSGRVVGVSLVLSAALALVSPKVYGAEVDLILRALLWNLHFSVVWVVAFGIFHWVERRAHSTGKRYVIVTLGIHFWALLFTLPIGHLLAHWHVSPGDIAASFSAGSILAYLGAGVLFELAVLSAARESIETSIRANPTDSPWAKVALGAAGGKCILRMIGIRAPLPDPVPQKDPEAS